MDAEKKQKGVTKREFIRFLAQGKTSQLFNEHNEPLTNFIHPLIYSEDPKHHPDIQLIPQSYKFQRKFYERYQRLKKI